VSFRICTDIGGSFTDLAIIDDKGEVNIFKVPTTLADYIDGVMADLELVGEYCKMTLRKLLEGTAPAIIEEPTTTIVVPPKSRITVTKWGRFLIESD